MEHIKRLTIFDLDGTLLSSPEPTEENRKLWASSTNLPLGKGWWSNPNSLHIDIFKPQLIEHVKADALNRIADETCYTVLLTGRMPRFSKIVKEILRLGGVPYFDDYFFNDSNNTLAFKLKTLEHLHNQFPHVKELEMWEDRVEHMPAFEAWGEETFGTGFILHKI